MDLEERAGSVAPGASAPWTPNAYFALFLTHRRGLGILLARVQTDALRCASQENQSLKVKLSPSDHVLRTAKGTSLETAPLDEVIANAERDFAPWSDADAERRPLLDRARVHELVGWLASHAGSTLGEIYDAERGAALFLAATPTLESIAASYTSLLARMGIGEEQISVLALSTGPHGSFTGLRLGCAFAAGLVRARPRPLWALPTAPLGSLQELARRIGGEVVAGAWILPWDGTPSAVDVAPVTWLDVLLGIWALGAAMPLVDSPVATYAKDPGPVEKARMHAEAGRKATP